MNDLGHTWRRYEAYGIIKRAEADLKYKLTKGERRDLLKDNTTWHSDIIADVVDEIETWLHCK